jgi:hypothetical protein
MGMGCCRCRGEEGEAAVDGLEEVGTGAENSIVLVAEDIGYAGERNERGFVAVGSVNLIIQW